MAELQLGEQIAGYRIVEMVGKGGMGRVYRAVQPRLERMVALKLIRPEIAAEEAFRGRFQREAQLAASVDHLNVVPIYEAGEAEGQLFVAMRWVAGPDLRRVLAAEGPLDPMRALHLLRQLAAALDAAHRIGLVHRDVKPANALTEGERVYLSDFGLARSLAGAEDITTSGGFLGTVDYTAPELLDGDPAGAPADIYALGCVLFEMLTGSVPYPVESLLGKLHAHGVDQPPAPSSLRGELPRGLDHVIERALAKDPALRYSSAGELAAATEEGLRTPPLRRRGARPTRRPPRALPKRAGLTLILLLVLAALAAVGAVELGGSHHAQASKSHGRALPAEASLSLCRKAMLGAPRDCRDPQGGIEELGSVGRVTRMSTMDFEVGKVRITSHLSDPTGAVIDAPPGTSFIVIETTVTNLTGATQVFEPASGTLEGRETALWLLDSKGKIAPFRGPHDADYSVQAQAAVAALPLALSDKRLFPGATYSGELVFYYPTAALRSHPMAILEVHELGESFAVHHSIAGIRLRT